MTEKANAGEKRSADRMLHDSLDALKKEVAEAVSRGQQGDRAEPNALADLEAGQAEALQSCSEGVSKAKQSMQELFRKLQAGFEARQGEIDESKGKIKEMGSQYNKDITWLSELEKKAEKTLSDLSSTHLEPKQQKRSRQ